MMKKSLFPLILMLCFIAGAMSTGCKKETARPVTEHNPKGMDINEFAAWFADMAAKNQKDSLYVFYQDILKADSIAYTPGAQPFRIRELSKGIFEIEYSPGYRLIVMQDEAGNLTVKESFGFFAFDSIRTDLARRTGMLTDSINDIEASERMKDEDFFAFIEERSKIKNTDILEVGQPLQSPDGMGGVVPIYNLTDYEVDGNEYTISVFSQTVVNGQEDNRIINEPGRTIAPKDSIHIEVIMAPQQIVRVNGIKFKLTQEEMAQKYAPLTGNEYKEYLETKSLSK